MGTENGHNGSGLADGRKRILLRRRGDRTASQAEAIAVRRLADQSHDDARMQLRISVDAYRRARRWLRISVARCIASPEPLGLSSALHEYAGEVVANALRIGALEADGKSHEEIRRLLRLSEDEWDEAWDWWRDATTLVIDD